MGETSRRRWRLVVTVALLGFLAWSVTAADPPAEDRALAVGSQIRCPVCQGESIADSSSGLAQDMMGLVRERIAAGWTDEEIIDELLSSYSGAQLLDPPLTTETAALVAVPAVVLLAGIALIVGTKRRPGPVRSEATVVGPTTVTTAPATRSKGRLVAGGVILAGGLAAAVTSAVFLTDGPGGAAQGAAAPEASTFDPADFSDETLEAVIAEAEGDPAVADQIPFMRFALAERYFEGGEYQKAFPHYQTILEGDPPPELAASALTRLGWIVWAGNGEAELAIGLFDRAIEADPANPEPYYTKAQVTWCGLSDPSGAEPLLARVLEADTLDDAVRSQVEADLAAVRSGEACP